MKRTASKLVSLLLALSMITSMLITTSFAAENGLTFEFPEATYGTDVTATVDLYKGIPTSSSTALATMVNNRTLTVVATDVGETGCAMPETPGTYCYHVHGEGTGDYYSVLKLFNITAEDIAAGQKHIVLEGGKCAGEGYEPGYKPPLAPDTYKKDNRDSDLMNWPDEVLQHFKIAPQGYQTPAFDGQHAQNEFTSQEEMMAFVQDRTASCDYMYLYSAGETPNYHFDLPMVLVTTTAIPEGATLEQAAAAVTADGKVNVWYQSQIHPNEPAAGEGSLVIIDDFINDPAYKALLDKVNVIVVPRINPDGSYLFTRATYDGFDMNRDHTSLKAAELAQLHTAWRLFMTEVVIDTHEFTYYGYTANGNRMSNADDIQTTPASSLNNDPTLNAMALQMAAAAFEKEKNADVGEGYSPIRVNHYGGTGWTTNPPIGRCYFGLFDCLSFLIETRGIGAGKNNFERRVFTQEQAVTAYLEYAATHAGEIKEAVAAARTSLAEQGKTYDESKTYALYQTASGEKVTPYTINSYAYQLDGTQVTLNENRALPLNDTAERSRPRPTAYVIPADHPNIEKILYIFDNQGAEYYELAPGSAAELQQYYYVGPYVAASRRTVGFEAGLRDAAMTAFPNGAYVIPMDQVAANVIAAICEPDVNDSNGYDGSLAQYGAMSYDSATKNYPLYRYTGNNPRETLVSNTISGLAFVYPEKTYGANVTAKLRLLKGYPTSTSVSASWLRSNTLVEDIQPISEGSNILGCPMPEQPGFYSYYVEGEGYYKLCKVFNLTDADIAAGGKFFSVEGGKYKGTGYEPTISPADAPPTYKQDSRDATLINWPDEVLENAFSVEDQGYKTPAFTWEHAAHELTSQEKMEAYVQQSVDRCDYMYLYSAGKSPALNFNLPIVLITTTPIPEDATLAEAAAIVTADGKTNIWYQSQIHPNEPASGEASLVMLDNFIDDPEYRAYLDNVNVVLIPRINPEGSYLYSRATYGGFDMNRDHTSLKAAELAQLHTAWYLFKTEVVIDTHEFNWYGARNDRVTDADDIETTPATSLNHSPVLTDIALDMSGTVFEAERAAGLRVDHYQGTGWTTNPPIGRCYFGLLDCLSFLIETRGIGGGMNGFERRVRSQEVAVTGYIKYTAEHAQQIKDTVAEERAKLIEAGKTYDPDSVFALYQTASGEKKTPYLSTSYAVDMKTGEWIPTQENWALSLNDTAVRSRVRPTAYVIPADHPNIDRILYIFDHQSADYYKLAPGSTAELQQYYYVGPYTAPNGRTVGFEAGLRDAAAVMFKGGAYVIPMDQLAANVIAAICEPDVNDSNGYDGSLAQFGLIAYDSETKDYPIYRYTGDNPRENLVSNPPAGLSFSYPEKTYGADVTAKLTVLKGYPTSTSVSASWIRNNTLYADVQPASEGSDILNCPMPEQPGLYSYYVEGEGYYKLCKVFNLTEEDIALGGKFFNVEGGKYKGTGYEPTISPADAPASYKQDSRDATLINWPDEVLENAFSVEDQGYKTPAFTIEHAAHELTSQEKMEAYVQQSVDRCEYMYLYSAGRSPALNFNLPLVLITTTPIPENATLAEAAAIVTADGKTNIWYQSQIHPNEPASGEASLVMLDNFIDDPEYRAYLDNVNVVLIPRINPEGSYLYSRATYGGFDMNRDHTSLKAAELAQLHTAWNLFKTEVVIDTHEFNWYGARNDRVTDADDLETTPATSLNHSPVLTDIALDMSGTVFEAARAAGIRVDHYQGDGWTVNPPIGRCYFGLLDCLSFLIETRGIGGGMNGFERRVRSQEVAVTGYIKYTAEHAKMIKDTVAEERAKLIESGKTYDPNSLFALNQKASGEKVTPYLSTSYAVDMKTGEWIVTQENWALKLNDTMVRSRPRPTAYVVPADHPNIEKILYILDNQSAEYFLLDPGFSAKLQQYYYADRQVTYPYPDYPTYGVTVDVAGLRAPATVTFENGAYLFPMDQLAANVIASIFEPDMTDSAGYDGSLFQYKADGVNPVMDYDKETKDFPLYRYTGNNPRENLVVANNNSAFLEVAPDTIFRGDEKSVTFDFVVKKLNGVSAMQGGVTLANDRFEITNITAADEDALLTKTIAADGQSADFILFKLPAFENVFRYDAVSVTVTLKDGEEPIDLEDLTALIDDLKVSLEGAWVDSEIVIAAATTTIHVAPDNLGDVDGDGDVDLTDLTLAMSYFGAKESDRNWFADYIFYSDVNADGIIDMEDLCMISDLILLAANAA